MTRPGVAHCRFVCNKSDTVNPTDLSDSLGGLKFNLGQSLLCPEVPKVCRGL